MISGGKMKHLSILILLLAVSVSAFADTSDLVNSNLRMLAQGKVTEVKAKLPDLLAEYPNDPGVKLLHAAVLNDAFKAIDIYRSIIRDYPDSQWADDSYWRIVQFYAVLGDTTAAQSELDNFRKRYPTSVYLGPASDVVNSSIDLVAAGKKEVHSSNENKNISVQVTQKIEPDKTPDQSTIKNEPPPVKIEHEDNTTEIVEEQVNMQEEPVTVLDNTEELEMEVIEVDDSEDVGPAFYGLQVGIYQNQESAEAEKEKFLKKRMRTEITEKNINGQTMYAVVIGNYSSMESAEAAKIIVNKQCDCNPIIYKK